MNFWDNFDFFEDTLQDFAAKNSLATVFENKFF